MQVEITEPSGKTWIDAQWIDAPDEEDCIREYNPGCVVEITLDDGEMEIYST